MSTNKHIGERLIAVMEANNITVKGLSEKTGLAHGTISGIRNGKNHYTWQLQLICDELNISPTVLFDNSPSMHHTKAINEIIQVVDIELVKILTSHIKSLNKLKN